MKKWIFAVALCLALSLTVCLALADSHPVNPYQTRVRELDRKADQIGRRGVAVRHIVISTVQEPALGKAGKWTVSVAYDENDDGELPPGTAITGMDVSIRSLDPSGDYSTEYLFHDPSTTLESCVFVAPGNYELVIFYEFSNGTCFAGVEEITIEGDGSTPTVEEKVAEVLAECRVAGNDWQTALNIHDWLTKHAYYDYTYSFYGAEDVLIRGYGVCDSYSKAFWFLMNAAGITHRRVISTTHAWNAVKLDNQWYHVDATWDDPGDAQQAVSGNEYHDYFCINDELIYGLLDDKDKTHKTGTNFNGSCNSLDMSYPIHEGTWVEGALYVDQTQTQWKTCSYADLILAGCSGGAENPFTIAGNQGYPSEGGGSYSAEYQFVRLKRYYYACGLTKFGLQTDNGQALDIDASYDYDLNKLAFTVSAEVVDPGDNGFTVSAAGETDNAAITGEQISLAVSASWNYGQMHYQWYYAADTDATPDAIEGAEASSLETSAKAGIYTCTVTDDFGHSTSIQFQVTADTSWADLEAQMNAEGDEILITLQGNVTAADDSCRIEIPEGKTITIDLNGYTIDRNMTGKTAKWDGYVFLLYPNTTLIIEDSSEAGTGLITGTNSTGTACIYSSGTVIINGGTIAGNPQGAIENWGTFILNDGLLTDNGIYVQNGEYHVVVNNGRESSFTMNGGSISGNPTTAMMNYGEFVMNDGEISGNDMHAVANHGSMTMKKGTISGNCRDNPTGFVIYNVKQLTITGGTISGNMGTSVIDNSGEEAVFSMTGGEIVNNTAKGIVHNGSSFSVSGLVRISGNRPTNTGFDWDVYLIENKMITIAGELSEGTQIGVTTYAYGGSNPSGTHHVAFTSGFLDENGEPTTYSTYFFSDRNYMTILEDGELALASSYGFEMDEPEFVLPDGLLTIETEAFSGTDASVVQIPYGAVSIESKAFADSTALRQIFIPESVTEIGTDLFDPRIPVVIFGTLGSEAYQYATEHDHCSFVQKEE